MGPNGPRQVIVLPLEAEAALAAPHQADDLDRLGQGVERFSRAASHTPVGGDGVPEGARPQPQLEATTAQHVDAGGGLGHRRRRAQRETGDVGEHPDPLGRLRHGGEQHEGVVEPSLIRVVLDPGPVEPESLGLDRHGDGIAARIGDGEATERDLSSPVGHRPALLSRARRQPAQTTGRSTVISPTPPSTRHRPPSTSSATRRAGPNAGEPVPSKATTAPSASCPSQHR